MNARPNWTFLQKTPAGYLYIIIVEQDGKPVQLFIHGPKNGTELRAMCNVIESLAGEMLPDRLNVLMEHLSNVTTDKNEMDLNGISCRSVSEGIFIALLKYQQMKMKEFMATFSSDYEPATMDALS